MEWQAWQHLDAAIRAEFGYRAEDDLAAAHELHAMLPPTKWRTVGTLLRNRHVTILGAGPGLLAVPATALVGRPVVACDGATQRARELGIVPDVVVTDLDGQPEALEWAASAGSTMVVHAHGDNRPHLAALVPRLGPQVHGTHQVKPTPDLEPMANFGGFTDGDRAVLLCEAMGTTRATLVGFDFDKQPSPYSHRWDPATKAAKLAWARRIVMDCQRRGRLSLQRPGLDRF